MTSAKKVGSVATLGCAAAERERCDTGDATLEVEGFMSKTFFAAHLETRET